MSWLTREDRQYIREIRALPLIGWTWLGRHSPSLAGLFFLLASAALIAWWVMRLAR